MDWLTDPQIWIALATLTVLEIVLGIDNIIFISILSGKLPADAAASARGGSGCSARCSCAIALLFSLAWIIRLTRPLFTVLGHEISGRDLILILGGLFLLAKATLRDPRQARGRRGARVRRKCAASFGERDRADHAPRHRLLARLGHHGRRHGRSNCGS